MRADVLGDPGAADDPADDPGRAVAVQAPAVAAEEQRPFGALADCKVDRPGGTGCEGDGDDLAALAGDDKGPVAALGAHVLDVRFSSAFRPSATSTERTVTIGVPSLVSRTWRSVSRARCGGRFKAHSGQAHPGQGQVPTS
jgi:hypothetical protein